MMIMTECICVIYCLSLCRGRFDVCPSNVFCDGFCSLFIVYDLLSFAVCDPKEDEWNGVKSKG